MLATYCGNNSGREISTIWLWVVFTAPRNQIWQYWR